VSAAIRLLNAAAQEMRDSTQPQLLVELAWLDSVVDQAGAELVPRESKPVYDQAPAVTEVVRPIPASEPEARSAAKSIPFGSEDVGGRRQPAAEGSQLPQATAPVPDTQVVEMLRAHWKALLQAAEVTGGGSLRGALGGLRHVMADGSEIYFAFEKEFSKSVVERPANRAALQDLLSQVLGKPVRLHCQVGSKVTGVASTPSPQPPPPAQPAPPSAEDLTSDPVVQHARQTMGAVISPIPPGRS